MNRKEKILIICFNTLHNDPRVLRQINALKNDFEVVTAGYSDPEVGVEHVQMTEYVYKMIDFYFNYPIVFRKLFAASTQVHLKTKRIRAKFANAFFGLVSKTTLYERQYWTDVTKENYRKLKDIKFDYVLSNDIHTLPLAVKLKKTGVKLIFDAHEYSPGENDSNPEWLKNQKPKVEYICRKYFPYVDLMFCVGYSIAEEYKKHFGISSVVITNATDYVDLKPKENNTLPIKLIHHGASIAERHLDVMIQAMDLLGNNYTLDMMLIPTDPDYLARLKQMGSERRNVNFIDPVPTAKIPYVLNDYDAGIVLIPPVNFNYEFCLPNKFYESVQGRVALILGPTKDMVDISSKYGNAIVTKDFTSKGLYEAVKDITQDQINIMKMNSDKCAKDLNADKNKEKMLLEIKKLVN